MSKPEQDQPIETRTPLRPDQCGRLSLSLTAAGLLGGLIMEVGWSIPDVRGVFGSLGFMAAANGAAISAWCSIRVGDRGSRWALLLNVPSVLLWHHLIGRVIHG